MKAISLFGVFAFAKVASLAGHSVPVSLWVPVVLLWQDAVVALLFGLAAWKLPERVTRILYWLLAGYAAVNIPVVRAVATPLTLPMLRAARGPLADSILLYLTPTNVVLVLMTLVVAALLFRPLPPRLLAGVYVIAALGPFAPSHADPLRLGRNAAVTLVTSMLPHVEARADATDWRASRFPQPALDDLSRLRGIAQGRNVILVSLESTAAQYLSLYGGEHELTPNLTALAKHGVVFENAYAAYPESIKGLFSILCSTFPAFDSQPKAYETAPCRAMPEILVQAGYRTGLFHSGRFNYLGMPSIIRNRGYQTLEDAGDIGGRHESSFGVEEPATVTRMLAWLDAVPKGERFFLTYLPIAGHHPYETPEAGPFPEHDELGRYRNSLLYGDASLGALIEGIRARGLADKTLWIILGDHGEAFNQHEGNTGHTFFLYDENVRVPFIVAAPGAIAKTIHAGNVISLVDTAPTILDLLGIETPELYQGSSALDTAPRMALFFTDYSLSLAGVRDGRYKFIRERGSGRTQLFDLENDPRETRDISAAHAERVRWYTSTVEGWSSAQKRYVMLTSPLSAERLSHSPRR